MTILSELESYSIPYNVLAEEESTFDLFEDLLKGIDSAWSDFQKNGKITDAAFQEAFNASQGKSFDFSALIIASIGLVGSVVPGAQIAVPFLTIITKLVWNIAFGKKADGTDKNLIKIIDEEVKKIVKEELDKNQIEVLNGYLDGYKTNIDAFNKAVTDSLFNGNVHSDPTGSDLTSIAVKYASLIADINNTIAQFILPSRAANTVPMFCIAATLQLTAIRDFINYGTKWIHVYSDSAAKKTFQDNLNTAKQTLRTYIQKYTNNVYTTFKNNFPNEETITSNSGYQTNPQKSKLTDYNRYVQAMVTKSFNVAAIWPTLIPDDYPYPAVLEQTKLVFSAPIGPDEISNGNLSIYDTVYDRHVTINSLYYPQNTLTKIDIAQYTDPKVRDHNACYAYGMRITYQDGAYGRFTMSSNAPEATGSSFSHTIADKEPFFTVNAVSQYVSKTKLDMENISITADSYSRGGSCYIPGYPGASGYGASNNQPISNYKINTLFPITSTSVPGAGKLGLVASHIPVNLTPVNIIGDSDSNGNMLIKGFPAEKAVTLSGYPLTAYTDVNKTEWVNGANAINLKPSQQLTMRVVNTTAQKYQIRYRAATKNDGNKLAFILDGYLNVLKDVPNTSTWKCKDIHDSDYDCTIEGNDGNKYLLVTDPAYLPPIVTLPPGTYDVNVINYANAGDILLDRIEFVPVDPIIVPPNSPIHKSVPNTVTQLSTTKEIWSSTSDYATTISFTGNVYNDASITFQLLSSGQVVKEFSFTGNGVTSKPVFHGSSPSCYNTPYPFSQPEVSVPKYNKLQVLMESGGYSKPCDLGDSFPNTFDAEIDIKFNLSDTADLAQITAQVQGLFTSSSFAELAPTVSSYQINQVAMKVHALSDEVFCKEKIVLRKLVNKAKQFMKTRNLLIGGDFEILDEWFLGRNVIRRSDNDLFTGDYLFLPPAALYPSYAYQKVDESKLKPYTRYTVSGFVAQSEHLEIVVSRYGKEIDKILNVPYEEALPVSSGNQSTCCKPASCSCSACTGGPHPHFFSYSIDVGKLYPDLNPGIEFGLRVKPNGLAFVGNLEIREDRPLTEREIKKLQRTEAKWKKAWDTERAEISALLQPVINRMNTFYKNADWNSSILPHVTYQDLYNVVLPELPKVRHWFMEDREGEHYGIIQQLQQALDRVFTQLEERNLIHNGSFTNELSNWLVEGDAKITTLESGNLALQLSDWDASASQSFDISDFDEDKEYTVRVYAKGKGTIRIVNCENEPLSFNTNTFTILEQRLYFDNPSVLLHVQSEGSEFVIGSVELIELSDDE